jgi:2-polyprenyl-3-methyl-5-hydroxy-6-metoxy-1,4-benzoquinol methylase
MEVRLKLDYDALEEFRDPQTYDLECDEVDEELPLIEQWARSLGGPLLDVACGTGRTALRLAARGYQVTGLDVTLEMIEQGRQKAAAQAISVEWVVADSRTFQLRQKFRFSYMVGNAFQCILTRADQEALLACVREHLHPEGCFLFETRNPSLRNLYEIHHPEARTYTTPDGGHLVITEDQPVYDPMAQIQHYVSHYRWVHPAGHGVEKTKRIALRYVFPQEIEALLFYNGWEIRACYGSWQQEPLTATSREMIYVCQRRV